MGSAAPAAAGPGGAYPTEPAKITAVDCVADCAGVDAAQPGSLLRIRGRGMRQVAKIVFLGGSGWRDNATATVLRQRGRSVDVTVPQNAPSGRLRAVNGDGARSKPSRAMVAIQSGPESSAALDVRVVGRGLFYLAAARPARADLMARQPMTVALALVRVEDGAVVNVWPAIALQPGVVQSITWDGTVGGIAQPSGRYEFRVFEDAAVAQATVPGSDPPAAAPGSFALASSAFNLADAKFPVRGKHDFGASEAVFGAGRDGRLHQGQDVFADCGTPLLAARGGVVKANDYQGGAAGNYIVVDGEGTEFDYAYMHMREPSPLPKGARVRTGQLIGHVGDTGRATGCHLHFEIWSAPGWSTGGAPIDPLPLLTAWDAYS